jgi:hypothetical protein
MPLWTPDALARQVRIARQNGLLGMLVGAAARQHLPPAFVVAVASRETGIRNILGDGGHGVGVIQIDTRYHALAREMKANGTWKTQPGRLIEYGAGLLRHEVDWAKAHWPQFDPLKIAAAAYNAGEGNARRGVEEGDADAHDTGHDYAADVLKRMRAIEEFGL